MPKVWNPTEEHVHTKMHGAWFSFKPGAFKVMDQNKCDFITTERKETGLVVLPNQFDPSSEAYEEGFEKTEAGKAILADLKKQGIRNLVEFHLEIVKNNQISMRNDQARKNPSGDAQKLAALEASPGELESMRLVSKYKNMKQDSDAKKMSEVEKLMEDIGPISD